MHVEVLLEPETRYRITGIDGNKPDYNGLTWVTIEVIESSPVIDEVIKEFTKAKEGIHISVHSSNSGNYY